MGKPREYVEDALHMLALLLIRSSRGMKALRPCRSVWQWQWQEQAIMFVRHARNHHSEDLQLAKQPSFRPASATQRLCGVGKRPTALLERCGTTLHTHSPPPTRLTSSFCTERNSIEKIWRAPRAGFQHHTALIAIVIHSSPRPRT